MKNVIRIDRPYIYIVFILVVSFGLLRLSDYIEIDAPELRLMAMALATVVGILIGLVAATVTSIVRVSIAQKQFYQGVLASEYQWLKDWFAAHSALIVTLGDEIGEVLYLIYRHSSIAATSDEELIERVGKIMLPLPSKWRKSNSDDGKNSLKKNEIDEFETHVHGIGATLSQIKASKDRMRLGSSLSDVLWPLGLVLLISLILIIFASISNPPAFISYGAASFGIALMEIAVISVLFIIWAVTRYLRAETKEITRVEDLKLAQLIE